MADRKRRGRRIVDALLGLSFTGALLGAFAGVAATSAPAEAAKKAKTMPIEDVRRGMKGHALTVFHGNKPDRFEIEVVDVVQDYMTGQDAVLFTSPDPRLEHSGIVGGMSGSPIFIEGKLVGALAYGYPFNKDPLGGLTPIDKMLEVGELPYRPDVLRRPRAQGREGSAAWADAMLGLDVNPLPARKRPDEVGDVPAAGLAPIGAPLTLRGFGSAATSYLADATGLIPVRGGAGSSKGKGKGTFGRKLGRKTGKRKWGGGDSVSVILIDGDNSAAANGTITWVGGKKGEQLLAFGHPMYGSGATRLPFGDAHVHTIINSVQRSVKLSSPGEIHGTMIQDRQPAISLRTDVEAPMIPVATAVQGPEEKFAPRSYENAIADDPLLTPNLAVAILLDAVREAGADSTEVVVHTKHTVALDTSEGPKTWVIEEETFFPDGVIAGAIARSRAFILMAASLDNEFEMARIRSVEQEAKVVYGAPIELVERIRVPKSEVRPGDVLELVVELRRLEAPLRPEVRRERVRVRIPEEAAGKKVMLEIAGGDFVRPQRPRPRDLITLLDTVAEGYSSRSLVASVYTSGEGLSTHAGLLHDLPDSVLETLNTHGSTKKQVRFKKVARRVIDTPTIISGTASIEIDVLEPRLDR